MDLSGSICVVTGASSGIGRRTALDLSLQGAAVCVTARRIERLRSLVAEMGEERAGHSCIATDVSKKKDVAALGSFVRQRYGRCDVLVNNAGFSKERPFHEPGAVQDLEKVMKTNFNGAVYCTAELLPLLLQSAPSHVVNVSSIAGRLAAGGLPAYCASKFALAGWSEALRYQLAGHGVYVSTIEPGLIPTEGFPQSPFLSNRVLKHTLGSVEQVSAAILQVIRRRKSERFVPRWYYLLQVPRLLSPPLYRFAERKLAMPRRDHALE